MPSSSNSMEWDAGGERESNAMATAAAAVRTTIQPCLKCAHIGNALLYPSVSAVFLYFVCTCLCQSEIYAMSSKSHAMSGCRSRSRKRSERARTMLGKRRTRLLSSPGAASRVCTPGAFGDKYPSSYLSIGRNTELV